MPLLKRVPLHSSHTSSTSARNCISTVTVPSPWQVSQRPPGMLKEKWPARVSALFGLAGGGEQGADDVEGLDVGDRVGARRAADGRLVDHDGFGDALGAFQLAARHAGRAERFAIVVQGRLLCGAGRFAQGFQGTEDHIVHQGGFAGARKRR